MAILQAVLRSDGERFFDLILHFPHVEKARPGSDHEKPDEMLYRDWSCPWPHLPL